MRNAELKGDSHDLDSVLELIPEDSTWLLQDDCADLLEEHAALHACIARLLRDNGVLHGDDLLALYTHHTKESTL